MKKTILALFLVLFALLSAPAYAANTPEEAMSEVSVYSTGVLMNYLSYQGTPESIAMAFYTGISITGAVTEYPAYCIEPEKPGPYEVGTYKINVKDYVSNPKVYGIISNGWPYKT